MTRSLREWVYLKPAQADIPMCCFQDDQDMTPYHAMTVALLGAFFSLTVGSFFVYHVYLTLWVALPNADYEPLNQLTIRGPGLIKPLWRVSLQCYYFNTYPISRPDLRLSPPVITQICTHIHPYSFTGTMISSLHHSHLVHQVLHLLPLELLQRRETSINRTH